MTIIHTKSKNIKTAYTNYINRGFVDLSDEYTKPSSAKVKAWNDCCQLEVDMDGLGLSVISANTMQFTAGFVCVIDGKDAFVWITKENVRYIHLDEIDG